jgi:transglutaminase-like superfamily./putative cell wall binding repeat
MAGCAMFAVRIKDNITREYVVPEQYGINGQITYSYTNDSDTDIISANENKKCYFVRGNNFTDNEISIINIIIENIRAMNETITINTSISPCSMRILLKESLKTPDIFWVTGYQMEYNKNGQTYYKIYPAYSMSANSKNSLEKKLQKETDLFLQNNAEALNHDVWTAAYAVNDWLCQNVTYTDEKNIQNGQYYPYNSIVAPLLRKEAICSGYAKTFAYLMNKAGYEAAYCTGYTNGGIYHAWNAIVYNGEITYIDSTYNASGNHMAYFCRNKEDLKERTENLIIWFSASDD